MRVGIYAGTFNPWHEGHSDILNKALRIFDKVIIAIGENKNKTLASLVKLNDFEGNPYVEVKYFNGLLVDFIKELQKENNIRAIVRGLRNGSDLQYEENMQYWNEDLGINIPTIYFICDRKLSHYSSSTIREIMSYNKDKDK